MKSETIKLLTVERTPLYATAYSADNPSKASQATILYLHGGGLIFGHRDDLPEAYIQKFTQAGHLFISVDYLLSPETKLDKTLAVLKQTLSKVNDRFSMLDNLVLMGRSAGAYLCYLLLKNGINARGFISLYGYYQITSPEFTIPTPYYTQFPRVLPMEAQSLIQHHPLAEGNMKDRYPIYVSGRQFGTWLGDFIPLSKTKEDFSLTQKELSKLPPTILIHSKNDPDVPFKISLTASQIIPNATLIPVKSNDHDFDRIVTTESLNYYDEITTFIDKFGN